MNTRGIRYDIIHIMSQTDPLFSHLFRVAFLSFRYSLLPLDQSKL